MGTITMVDGSHKWREIGNNDTTVRHFAERDKSELDVMLAENAAYNGVEVNRVQMDIPKGHLSFHHCRTYHGSGPNRSDRPRRAISLHLQDGANAFQEFRLSTGELARYNHDELVRRTADGRPDYADPEFCPTLWRSER
jgi:ectoine hydroxylase-related dioxygenase (phytanoyl-CoA dioxygenase family)